MNIDSNQPANVQVNSKEVGVKLRSKKECFQFLVVDCQVYLPDDHACVTTYFLKQLCSGEKKCKFTSFIMKSLRHQEERALFNLLSAVWKHRCKRHARKGQVASRTYATSAWWARDPLAAASVACKCDLHNTRTDIQGLGGRPHQGAPRKVCKQE